MSIRLLAVSSLMACVLTNPSCLRLALAADVSPQELLEQLRQVADTEQDAAPVLQSLVDAQVGHIVLPPGRLRLQRGIEIDLGTSGPLDLQGSSRSELVMAAAGPALSIRGSHMRSADPAGVSPQVWQRERMPVVRGVAIRGDHPQADGIRAAGTMQLTLAHLHLRQLQHGVQLIENNRNVLIESCHIYENRGVGILYDNVNLHQSNIVGCHISYCDQGGIVSRQGNVRNLHITGCDIESNMAADSPPTANVFIDCRNSDHGTAEVAITGCTIQHNNDGPQSANIRIIGRSNRSRTSGEVHEGNITITGNVLSDVQHNLWLEGCRGVTITGNTFWMGFEHNLLIEGCSHIVMAANNFDRNPRYDYGNSTTSKNRVVIRDSHACTLSGLHISQVRQAAGLTMENCQRCNVSALTILDCEVGLRLINVSHSLFSACWIGGSRPDSPVQQLDVQGGEGNRFDFSLSE